MGGGRATLLRRSFSSTAAAAVASAAINVCVAAASAVVASAVAVAAPLRLDAARLLTLNTPIIAHFSTFMSAAKFSTAA